jgi:hypothetical protein
MTQSCLENYDAPETTETYLENCMVVENSTIRNCPSTGDSELGFGTDYEKVILAEILSQMTKKYELSCFFNFPKNCLLGNTKDITKNLAEKNVNPDLLWNFCEFENENDVGTFFKSIEDFNPKYILIVTQNWRNPGVLIHFMFHKVFGKEWDHGLLRKMAAKPIEDYIKSQRKYELIEKGLFDAPWFILDVYETGKYLKKLLPKSKAGSEQPCKSLFETSPSFIKKWASHHNYVLIKNLDAT